MHDCKLWMFLGSFIMQRIFEFRAVDRCLYTVFANDGCYSVD